MQGRRFSGQVAWGRRRRDGARTSRSATALGALCWLAIDAGALASPQDPVPQEPIETAAPRSAESDPLGLEDVSWRSLERFRYDCRNEIDRRDVTLFANGTLRLRQGPPGKESMWLVELAPEERDAYLARLAADNREESEIAAHTVGGEWVERCRLAIQLPGRLPEEYELSRFDSLSLGLRRAVAIAEELIARVDVALPPEGASSLPADYHPAVGDELRRLDGAWFRVEGYTADGRGVELSGLEEPVVVYIATADLAREFVELRRRERFGR